MLDVCLIGNRLDPTGLGSGFQVDQVAHVSRTWALDFSHSSIRGWFGWRSCIRVISFSICVFERYGTTGCNNY